MCPNSIYIGPKGTYAGTTLKPKYICLSTWTLRVINGVCPDLAGPSALIAGLKVAATVERFEGESTLETFGLGHERSVFLVSYLKGNTWT